MAYCLSPIASSFLYMSKRIFDCLRFHGLAEDGDNYENDKRDRERNDLGVNHVPRVARYAV
jgi:hypothetical protein